MGMTCACQDLRSENEALKRQVAALEIFRALAYRDALTGLWNRRYFEERVDEELSRARRNRSHAFSILMIDVNGLKRINDRFGHAAGDEHIAAAARFLVETLRGHDVVCRIGGDEFAVILPEVSTPEVSGLIQRLRVALDSANRGRERAVGLSFGAATWWADGNTRDELMHAADQAMYRDKTRQQEPIRAIGRRLQVG